MNKALLLILSSVLTFASLANGVMAQTEAKYFGRARQNQEVKLTNEQWRNLTRKYYQSRYRTKFTSDNNFLSLHDVRELLGDRGLRDRVSKSNWRQYWSWSDVNQPSKKIEGIFIYYRLISLKSRGFDRQQLEQIKLEVINQNKLESASR